MRRAKEINRNFGQLVELEMSKEWGNHLLTDTITTFGKVAQNLATFLEEKNMGIRLGRSCSIDVE